MHMVIQIDFIAFYSGQINSGLSWRFKFNLSPGILSFLFYSIRITRTLPHTMELSFRKVRLEKMISFG